MRMLLLLFALSPVLATAQAPDRAAYAQLIEAAWPQLDLRPDQQDWLVHASQAAYRDCRARGLEMADCDVRVRQALREQLGPPVREAALNSVMLRLE